MECSRSGISDRVGGRGTASWVRLFVRSFIPQQLPVAHVGPGSGRGDRDSVVNKIGKICTALTECCFLQIFSGLGDSSLLFSLFKLYMYFFYKTNNHIPTS